MPIKELTASATSILQRGGVFVPSPLALDENKKHSEAYQRLLTLYYIRSGARAVIPGAHTGEFALNDLDILDRWLQWIKEMSSSYGENMLLLAMVGGAEVMKQVELAKMHGYHAVMIAPTAFKDCSDHEVVQLFEEIATIIPTFAFELQRSIPGSFVYSPEIWNSIFDIAYGAKGASFDTYRSIVMLQAAANSDRKDQLVLFTGNDDRIVTDLLNDYSFNTQNGHQTVGYKGGLLGHFATDTHAAVNWFEAIANKKKNGIWDFEISEESLAHGVNRCNLALFDALGNFENSVWGVKYRLASVGLLPGPYCMHEKGRPGQDKAIDQIYNEYPSLNDNEFLAQQLQEMKREVGL